MDPQKKFLITGCLISNWKYRIGYNLFKLLMRTEKFEKLKVQTTNMVLKMKLMSMIFSMSARTSHYMCEIRVQESVKITRNWKFRL